MAAFQDYETAADGNGSMIIKLSTVSLSFFLFFFPETETRVVVISSKALFELWQLARQSPLANRLSTILKSFHCMFPSSAVYSSHFIFGHLVTRLVNFLVFFVDRIANLSS